MSWSCSALVRWAIVLLLPAAAGAQATTIVKVGVYANPPKVVLPTSGGPSGIYVEVLKDVERQEGYRFEYVGGTFQQGLERLERGEIDLMVDVAKTPPRDARFDFSQPVLQSWNEVYVRRGSPIRNLLHLDGRKVAVLAGSVQESLFRDAANSFGIRASLVPYATYAQAFEAVRSGAADAVVSNPFVGQVSLRGLQETAIIFGSNALHFAVARGTHARLLQDIDRHIAALKANPSSSYSKAFQALVHSQRPSTVPPWIYEAAVGGGLFLLLTTLWAVTARRAAARLGRAEATQRRLAEELQRIFDHSLDVICVLDEDLCIRRVSPAARRLGYEPPGLLGKSVLELVDEGTRGRARDMLARVRAGEALLSQGTRALRADGTMVEISFSAAWSPDLREMYCFIHDESERVALLGAAEFRELQLQKANQDLQIVSYSLSHDLRSPLAAIHGFISAVLDASAQGLDARSKGYLERSVAAARRMEDMVRELGALLQVAGQPLEIAPCNLSRMALDIVDALRLQSNPRPQVVIGQGLQTCADERMMRLALENLLGNAWKFSSQTKQPVIEFAQGGNEGDTAVYFVRDNGAGFDMAFAERLFRPFSRLHGNHEFPGSGMGLSIVQRIVTRHGGRVWAEGAPGQGATFYFTLGTRC